MSDTQKMPHADKAGRGSLAGLKSLVPALIRALTMLDPRAMVRNPVMFVTEVGATVTTLYLVTSFTGTTSATASSGYFAALAVALWATVYLANVAEAEARGKAQAASLRGARFDLKARRLPKDGGRKNADSAQAVPSSDLLKGDRIIVEANETIAADGDVTDGIASVDESAITGESAPVIRESGGDRSAVTGGTRVLSDWIVVQVSTEPGESFLDRMISMVEGADRQKTPNEIALSIVLAGFTLMFLMVCIGLYPLAGYFGASIDVPTLVALLSSVSHDLRTPLSSILGSAKLVRDRDAALSACERRELLDGVVEEAKRLDRFVQNLLDMTRLGYGTLAPDIGHRDVREQLAIAWRSLGSAVSQTLDLAIPEDAEVVIADVTLLRRVLANLLDNAVKYSHEASTIKITTKAQGAQVLLTISDSGPGIDADERERVFDMFYRIRNTDHDAPGPGLGLAICKDLVELMNGRIRAVAPLKEIGTRMELSLPAR